MGGTLEEIPNSIVDSIEKAHVDGDDVLIINVNRATKAPVEYNNEFPVRLGTAINYLSGREIVDQFLREKYGDAE